MIAKAAKSSACQQESKIVQSAQMSALIGCIFCRERSITVKPTIIVLLVMLSNAAVAGDSKISRQARNVTPVSIQGSWAGIKIISQIVRECESDQGSHFIKFTPRDSNQVPESLKKHECDV